MAAAEVSGAATRTWVLKTNENGFCELYSRFLVSGDDFYYTSSGVPTLPIGTVLIQETKAPEGYFINDTVYLVKISESGTDEAIINTYNAPIIPEQVYTGSVSISKTTVTGLDKHTVPEDGAVFEVYLKSAGSYAAAAETDRALLTTDAEGNASAGDLPYGTYTVHQVSGWEGNTLYPDFDVTISADGQSYHFTLNNERFYAFVLVKKVDATTGAEIPTAGVGFQVKDPTGRYVSDLAGANKWYTDENGFLRLPVELEYGKRYSLLELNAPSGYVLGSEPLYFDVTAENATDLEGQKVVEVTMENTPQMGTITVKKTGEYFASVTEREGVYQPVFKVGGLSGAEYSITAAEDIYTPDGTLRYRKNTVVDTLVTGEDGTATTKALYLGKFTVTETKAPHGMLLDSGSRSVELAYAGQELTLVKKSISFYNARQKLTLDLKKVMEVDTTFGIGSGREVMSVAFGLYAASDITAKDGSQIPADGLIEVARCDSNGHAVFQTDLPVGSKVYVKEISTDSHYLLSDTVYPVTFTYAGQNVATVPVTVNDSTAIRNVLIRGTVRGNKLNRETGEKIAGALFGLFDAAETDFTASRALMTAESDEDGVFVFENVVYGSYVVRELRAVTGYLENDTVYPVAIEENGAVVELTAVNDLIPELGTTATIDGEKEVFATEVLTLIDTVSYQHLVPDQEYTIRGILMDKASGEPLLIDGKQLTSEVSFTPEQPDGSIDVLFTFDARLIKADMKLVVFEGLYSGDKELAVHAELEDEAQTVTVLVPEIKTLATVKGKKEITASGSVTIEDTVSYKNLRPNTEYTIKGMLMDQRTGESFGVGNVIVVGETTFVPQQSEGTVTVVFTFNAHSSVTLVVFEKLYAGEYLLASHTDLADEAQTVQIHTPRHRVVSSPETGDGGIIMQALTAQTAVLGCLLLRRKRSECNLVST